MTTALFVLASFSDCTSTKESGLAEAKHFTITEAGFENWHAGRPEGGSGTDYRFIAVINTGATLDFDSVWIREKTIALSLTPGRLKGPATNTAFTFSKGDTIALYASTISETIPQKAAAPADLPGEAILSYRIEEKKAYKAIPKLIQKETQPRPQ